MLLRIEDHDAQRCRPEYERAILDDLDWLGFAPDEFPTSEFRRGWCASRQSNRLPIYERTARDLIARGLVYGCDCTRQQLREHAGATSTVDAAERRYPGTCRDRGLTPDAGRLWRLRLERHTIAFDDLICGPQVQTPADQCGDVVIRDRLGNWTYQFVVSIDDYLQGIDLVVRGRDLLASTGRQIQIAALLGRTMPAAFAHHALVMKSPTQKLSKADNDTAVRELRHLGREAILEAAARAAGLSG